MQEERVSQIRGASVVFFAMSLRDLGRARVRRLEMEISIRGDEEDRAELGEGGGEYIDEDIVDTYDFQNRVRAGWTIDIL